MPPTEGIHPQMITTVHSAALIGPINFPELKTDRRHQKQNHHGLCLCKISKDGFLRGVDVGKSKIKESTSQGGQFLMVTFWYSYMAGR